MIDINKERLDRILNSDEYGIWVRCNESQWQMIRKEALRALVQPLFFLEVSLELGPTAFARNLLRIINPSFPLDNIPEKDLVHLCIEFCDSATKKRNDLKRSDNKNKKLFVIINMIDMSKNSDFDTLAHTLGAIRYIYSISYESGLNWIIIDRFNLYDHVLDIQKHGSPMNNCFYIYNFI